MKSRIRGLNAYMRRRDSRMEISVIVCAHNKERYVDMLLPSVVRASSRYPHKIIVVADGCTDKTVEKCRRYDIEIIEKDHRNWRNSYAESLQLGLKRAEGEHIAIVDMDVVMPLDFFDALSSMIKGSLALCHPWVLLIQAEC